MLDTLRVTITGYDVVCTACGWTAHLPTGALDLLHGHHRPYILGVHSRLDGGAVELWRCRTPRALR